MAISKNMGLMAMLLIAAVASASADHIDYYPYKYYAYLKGKFEVPPLKTATWGFGYVEWNMTDMKVSVDLHNAMDIWGMHIHNGTMGMNGPIVIPIAGFMQPGTSMMQYISGDFSTYIMLKTADYPWIPDFLGAGMGYFNIHSMANPGGEVRGQIYLKEMPQGM
uniref:CHRD domain-containing protein n=1 Tax=Chlamydomonas sp. (strain W80) TaxID=103365 RepID=A0A2Z5T1P5_CHLSW|nr:hypothetical protein [Chlamydomonas sp. W80]